MSAFFVLEGLGGIGKTALADVLTKIIHFTPARIHTKDQLKNTFVML